MLIVLTGTFVLFSYNADATCKNDMKSEEKAPLPVIESV